MCLRGYRSSYYPNKVAFKVAKKVSGFMGGVEVFQPPFYGTRAKYKLGETFRAHGHCFLYIRILNRKDPRPYTKHPYPKGQVFSVNKKRVQSGSHLYTKKADAIRWARSRARNNPGHWVVLKCDISDVVAYGDDAWGRAVIAKTVTPTEVVWDQRTCAR